MTKTARGWRKESKRCACCGRKIFASRFHRPSAYRRVSTCSTRCARSRSGRLGVSIADWRKKKKRCARPGCGEWIFAGRLTPARFKRTSFHNRDCARLGVQMKRCSRLGIDLNWRKETKPCSNLACNRSIKAESFNSYALFQNAKGCSRACAKSPSFSVEGIPVTVRFIADMTGISVVSVHQRIGRGESPEYLLSASFRRQHAQSVPDRSTRRPWGSLKRAAKRKAQS